MLLVSAEKLGRVSHAVGGGFAAAGAAQRPPSELPAGEAVIDKIKLEAGSRSSQQFLLHALDYVSWICTVEDGYTVDFAVKLCSRKPHTQVRCLNTPLKLVGVDRSRVVRESERGKAFQGFLDLAEHEECVGPDNRAPGPVAVLVLELDNSFSFFTGKEVNLQVCKRSAVPDAARRSVSLRLPEAEASPTAKSESAVSAVPSMPSVLSRPSVLSCSEDPRLSRLRSLLREALRICPDATRSHLLAAQVSVEEYAQQHVEEDGPLS